MDYHQHCKNKTVGSSLVHSSFYTSLWLNGDASEGGLVVESRLRRVFLAWSLFLSLFKIFR
jgi:hypothetical protein